MTTTQIKLTDRVHVFEGRHKGLTGTVTDVETTKRDTLLIRIKLDNSPMSVSTFGEYCEVLPPTDQIIWLTEWFASYETTEGIGLYPTLESATLAMSVLADEKFGRTGALDDAFRKDLLLNGTVRWEYSDYTVTATPYKMSEILAKA